MGVGQNGTAIVDGSDFACRSLSARLTADALGRYEGFFISQAYHEGLDCQMQRHWLPCKLADQVRPRCGSQ